MASEILCTLINETVKERIKQIKEKAEASKTAHAKDVVKILEDEAKILDKLAGVVKKEYDKHEFPELKRELKHFEQMRDSKLAKAEALKKKHMDKTKKEFKKLDEANLGHNEISSIHQEGRFWIVTYRTMNGIKEKVFESEKEARKFYDSLDENKHKVEEKLSAKADAGEYVKDFAKSKAPQFKGKSKEKKHQMAVAAYLSKKK
jgi:hypothetical protein